MDDSDWGQSWVCVADSLTSGVLTKEDALFKHLSPACIIKCYRDSVVLLRVQGPPQPTSNAKPAAGRHKNKTKKKNKVLNGAGYY